MSQLTQASNEEVRQQYSQLFSEPGEAAAHGIPAAAMILDRSGTVRD